MHNLVRDRCLARGPKQTSALENNLCHATGRNARTTHPIKVRPAVLTLLCGMLSYPALCMFKRLDKIARGIDFGRAIQRHRPQPRAARQKPFN